MKEAWFEISAFAVGF